MEKGGGSQAVPVLHMLPATNLAASLRPIPVQSPPSPTNQVARRIEDAHSKLDQLHELLIRAKGQSKVNRQLTLDTAVHSLKLLSSHLACEDVRANNLSRRPNPTHA